MTDTHKPMSEKEIAGMRARCEAATEGPWKAKRGSRGLHVNHTCERLSGTPILAYMEPGTGDEEANARFFAHARADLPRCLDEIERQRGLMKQATERSNENV